MTNDNDLLVGDRVGRIVWDTSPDARVRVMGEKFGTVIDVGHDRPNGLGKTTTLYAVCWDDDQRITRGHLRIGLRKLPEPRREFVTGLEIVPVAPAVKGLVASTPPLRLNGTEAREKQFDLIQRGGRVHIVKCEGK